MGRRYEIPYEKMNIDYLITVCAFILVIVFSDIEKKNTVFYAILM